MPGEFDPRLAPYDYPLPPERIARYPPAERDGGRLLTVGAARRDLRIRELPSLLAPSDLLVVNDTRVLAARLRARRASGGAVELLLLEPGPGPVRAMARPGRRLKAGETLTIHPLGQARLLSRYGDGSWSVAVTPSPGEVMDAGGEVPLPPYLDRDAEADDAVRYQTVVAGPPGAVAAPTAGLHLTERLMAALQERGVRIATVTLHVGPGTFRSLRAEDLESGLLHREWYAVSDEAAGLIAQTRERGGRVIAVGTTVTRTLESAWEDGAVRAGSGQTRLFIRPGYCFRAVGGLLTNLHLPRSSLIMLVCAFGGTNRVMSAYQHALEGGYRFASYGDAMWVEPDPPARGP